MGSTSLLDIQRLFSFPLDPFQTEAIAALNAGKSVVVSAPTGSGKTVVGEYALHRALARGCRAFYTTPLKALSNQKLRDFQATFGAQQVGLLTGDRSFNREAPILVMTTEIFRNILYGTLIGDVGTSLAGVEVVILDECHYMNDPQRGTVWEEAVIYCPPQIQLVALSATIANAQHLTDWIGWVHGPTQLVASQWRPVPLSFHFGNTKGLFPLLNPQQTGINPRLRSHHAHKSSKSRHRKGQRCPVGPELDQVLRDLHHRQMLPAIYFIFSRRGCDRAVETLGPIDLLTPQESQQLQQQIDQFRSRYPDIGRPQQLAVLYRGIAAHHAGSLPLWKSFVEELFQQGMIKVVFATETLAAGINMPARTTVISTLSKRTDRGHRLLTPSEFLQMAGRAGRRGMDNQGHVVTLQTRFEGVREAVHLATVGVDPLVSQFTPSYGMVLNLLQTHTLDESKALIEKSFGQFLMLQHLTPQRQAIADLSQELIQVKAKLTAVDLEALKTYQKLQQRLKAEQRLLKILEQQAEEIRSSQLALQLTHADIGTLVGLKRSGHSPKTAKSASKGANPPLLAAVLVAFVPSSGQFPYFGCLGQDNTWYVVNWHQVMAVAGQLSPQHHRALAALDPPATLARKAGQHHRGDAVSAAIAQVIPDCDWQPAPEVVEQEQRLTAVQAQLRQHPAHGCRQHHGTYLKLDRRAQALERQLGDREAKLHRQIHRNWDAFLSLVHILRSFDALAEVTPTPLGQLAAALRGENELWLGLALNSGAFDALAPHHLAAACAALVTDQTRPHSSTHYALSPPIPAALRQLRPLRRQLSQLQYRYEVDLPVGAETQLVALVEQWALGTDWPELCAHTNLDEGDVVRMLRRTRDFLSQIPHAPYLTEALYENAKRAQHLIDRFPVNEINDAVLTS